MNTQILELLFRGVGLVLVGLVVANFFAVKRWRYVENLETVEPMVRQVFNVHCAYIISIIAGLALLCLGWPELLLEGRMSRVLCGFFGLFWGSRVVVQLTYYDAEMRRQNRGWDIFFLGVFLVLAVVFSLGVFAP